jgi:hypothetical protein
MKKTVYVLGDRGEVSTWYFIVEGAAGSGKPETR